MNSGDLARTSAFIVITASSNNKNDSVDFVHTCRNWNSLRLMPSSVQNLALQRLTKIINMMPFVSTRNNEGGTLILFLIHGEGYPFKVIKYELKIRQTFARLQHRTGRL